MNYILGIFDNLFFFLLIFNLLISILFWFFIYLITALHLLLIVSFTLHGLFLNIGLFFIKISLSSFKVMSWLEKLDLGDKWFVDRKFKRIKVI